MIKPNNKLDTYVALLRGINVGGNNIVSMTDLKVCLEELGHQAVRTYINSGNVIFHAAHTTPRRLEAQLEKAFADTFSFPTIIIVRNRKEMAQLIHNIPKEWLKSSDLRCNVMFLRHTIDSADILRGLNPKAGIEEVRYHPGAILWSVQRAALTRSSITKVIMKPIYKEMTLRTVNTAYKIFEIMSEP